MNQSIAPLVRSILISGLIVAFLDITAACLHAYILTGTKPAGVFRYVAMGAFGREGVMSGGTSMIFWGALFHTIIAISWTALFYVLYPRIKFLSSSIVWSGICYGILVWLFMNRVVVPLSLAPVAPFRIWRAATMVLIHMFVIGVPISYLANRYFSTLKS